MIMTSKMLHTRRAILMMSAGTSGMNAPEPRNVTSMHISVHRPELRRVVLTNENTSASKHDERTRDIEISIKPPNIVKTKQAVQLLEMIRDVVASYPPLHSSHDDRCEAWLTSKSRDEYVLTLVELFIQLTIEIRRTDEETANTLLFVGEMLVEADVQSLVRCSIEQCV